MSPVTHMMLELIEAAKKAGAIKVADTRRAAADAADRDVHLVQ